MKHHILHIAQANNADKKKGISFLKISRYLQIKVK